MFDGLGDGCLAAYASRFLTVMGTKPPLIAILPTPVYLIFGRRPHAAYVVNLLFLLILFGALYRLGRRYSSRRAGLLAVYTAGTMPVIYGLARWYLVECGVMAIVCVAILLLTEWGESGGASKAFLLGMTCGLGLLMKASFPLYMLAPMLYFAVRERRRILRGRALAAFAAPACLLALPWYVFNFRRAIETGLKAGSEETAKIYRTGEVLSLSGMSGYVRNVFDAGPMFYFAALLLLALAFRPAERRGLRLCAWWASPFVFLLFSHYRELRYAAPLYPAVALALAILIDAALQRRGPACGALVGALLALPALGMLQVSFGLFGDRGTALARAAGLATRMVYARMYDRAHWPLGEILGDTYRLTQFSGGEKKLALIGTDSVRFNTDIFLLEAANGKLPFNITTTAYETDLRTLLRLVNSADFFIYREGGEPTAPFFNILGGAEAVKEVRESGRFEELPISRTLPDGGVAHVFHQKR